MRFYHSQAWRKMSEQILRRDHYECQECRKKLRSGVRTKIKRATQVHHIVPYETRPDLGLDEDNLEAICDGCHNEDSQGAILDLNAEERKALLAVLTRQEQTPEFQSLITKLAGDAVEQAQASQQPQGGSTMEMSL